MIIMQYYP
jgi:hypothetical protein